MAMQKKFGQNFLINSAARERIVSALELSPGDNVWEVGPGLGCMSDLILRSGAKLTVFEIDRGFSGALHDFFSDYEKSGALRIVQGDVLKNWEAELMRSGGSGSCIKLFGNLPYNIAASFIADTISSGTVFSRCVFTVQREVAERMAARAGSRDYSAFSVLCQRFYDVELLPVLGAGNFWPRPNVASQTAVLSPRGKDAAGLSGVETKMFTRTVHALFSSRRKTVANNIKSVLPEGADAEEILVKSGIDPGCRAESLCADDFSVLSLNLSSATMGMST